MNRARLVLTQSSGLATHRPVASMISAQNTIFFFTFFLSLTSVYLPIVGVEIYCCTLNHTQTHSVGPLWRRDQPLAQTSTGNTKFTRDRQMGFEPAMLASERPQKPLFKPRDHTAQTSNLDCLPHALKCGISYYAVSARQKDKITDTA